MTTKESVSLAQVTLESGICISVLPSSKRASFPADCLPVFQKVTRDGLKALVPVPSPTGTALVGFAVGAVAAVTALVWANVVTPVTSAPPGTPTAGGGSKSIPTISMSGSAPAASSSPSALGSAGGSRDLRVAAVVAVVGAAAAAVRWWALRYRAPAYAAVNERLDVSSHPGGPCIVTGRALLLTNSHAGTHADTVAHFQPPPPASSSSSLPPRGFLDSQYTGPAVVLSVAPVVAGRGGIVPAALNHAAGPDFPWASVTRLLIRTTMWVRPENSDEWTNDFGYLDPGTVAYLRERCPNLVLVGIDTPSVDGPSAAPICKHSHGALAPLNSAAQPIAILENLQFMDPVFDALNPDWAPRRPVEPKEGVAPEAAEVAQGTAAMWGAVQTVFNPMADFEDARGCVVYFYPGRRPQQQQS